MTGTTRERAYHFTNEYISQNTLRSNDGYVGVGLPALRLADGAFLRAPPRAQIQIIPFNAPPACAPTRAGKSGSFIEPDYALLQAEYPLLDEPWLDDLNFDIPWNVIPQPDDPREGQAWPYLPWWIMWNSPWPWRFPSNPPFGAICVGPATDNDNFAGDGHGQAQILIGRNGARGTSGVTAATIDRWPDGVIKWVEPYLRPIGEGTNLSETFFKTMKDFQAPATDLNADGKSDILLLKLRDQLLGSDRDKNSFIPRAYISDGRDFHLDWEPTGMILGIDLAPFFTTTPAQLQSLQTFSNQVLPNLASVLPGTRVLPAMWIAPLRPTARAALTTLLASYCDADATNPVRMAAFTAALTKLFQDASSRGVLIPPT